MIKYNHSISVVIPIYNGAITIAKLVSWIEDVMISFADYRIILVNDKSYDESFIVIEKLAQDNKRIIAIDLKENYGQQRAIYMGLKYANCDYTVIMDDDLMQKPSDIVKLYVKAIKGYDVVYGINKNQQTPSNIRGFGSKLRDYLFYHVGGLNKNLKVCSFRIISYSIVKQICSDMDFVYISMEILRLTKNIGNIKVAYLKGGPTNYNTYKLVKLFLSIYIYYADRWFVKGIRKSKKEFEINRIINGEDKL